MNPPRLLLATDLDGTLLRSDGSVSTRAREALAAARDAGVQVLFVTGRPPQFLAEMADTTGHSGDVLCANGAMLTSLETLQPTLVRSLAHDDAVELTALLAEHDPSVEFRVMLHREGEQPLRLVGTGRGYVPEIHAHLADGWSAFKLAVITSAPDQTSDTYLQTAADLVGHLAEVTHSSPAYPIVEIAARGVHKGAALAEYASDLGLAQGAVHAVGDMPNDLPMLNWAGNSYAVANAHREVLAAVRDHLPSNDDDGVAVLLERLVDDA